MKSNDVVASDGDRGLITAEKANSSPKAALAKLRRKLLPKKANEKTSLLEESSPKAAARGSHKLHNVFHYFDENGDGKISPSELRSCVKSLSVEEAEAAVRSSDLDGDGLLGYNEFQKLMEISGEEEKNADLKEAFAMYEMEGTGCITPTSLKRMLSRLGESKSVEDCKAIIRAFDHKGDGVLRFDEFANMMS